jgi:hypothetical protein
MIVIFDLVSVIGFYLFSLVRLITITFSVLSCEFRQADGKHAAHVWLEINSGWQGAAVCQARSAALSIGGTVVGSGVFALK